jgi:hypothetical protein
MYLPVGLLVQTCLFFGNSIVHLPSLATRASAAHSSLAVLSILSHVCQKLLADTAHMADMADSRNTVVFADQSRSRRYAALARSKIVESSTIAMPPAQRSSDAGAAKMASIISPNNAPAAAPIRAL